MLSEKKEKAVDLSHHLSELSKSRKTSPLKGLSKYHGRPGLISLAGGMPNAAYFPFANLSGDALVPQSFSLESSQQSSSFSWLWKLFGASSEKTKTITVPKYPVGPDDVNLEAALQYGTATGLPQLQAFLQDFVHKVYQPAYTDCTVLMHTGNTDGWSRVAQTLLNPGEGFLTEVWTYPSALASSKPFGAKVAAVEIDGEGMRSDDLRKVLAEWNEGARGFKRPRVLYTVPVGQNPTGATMGAARKKEIYDICVEYDIIIVEDDPYYFLQEGPYVPKSIRQTSNSRHPEKWIANLSPSYVRFDYQGRVIRLDTFSKTIAPGARLGWFTCNPMFAERLERHGETSAQAPCGFGQSLVTKLLLTWGYDGYVRWMQGLAVEYTNRRDFLIDALGEEFNLELVPKTQPVPKIWEGGDVYTGSLKQRNEWAISEKYSASKKLLSFVAPTSGMFIWIKVHFEHLAHFKEEDEGTLEMQLWVKLAEAGVLFSPGAYFSAEHADDEIETGQGHFRIAFSNASPEDLKKAVTIFGNVAREFFKQ